MLFRSLARALRDGEQRRGRLLRDLAVLDDQENAALSRRDVTRIERDLRGRLQEWRQMLGRHTSLSRQNRDASARRKNHVTPHGEDGVYAFAGKATFGELLTGLPVPRDLVAVRGFEPRFRG